MLTKYILLILFFGAVYLCSSIIPALAPSEVKSTHKQILLLLKITAASTVFLIASNYANSDYLIGGVVAALVLVILFLVKENPVIYYFLPALVGLSIISENYYILTCMTTTLFLKGMVDYADVSKIQWSDKRVAMAIYLILTTTVVIIIAKTVNASSL